MSEKYNGWTNYETWAVKLWMDNDQGQQELQREWAEQAREDPLKNEFMDEEGCIKGALAYTIKEYHEEMAEELGLFDAGKAGVFSDLFNAALCEVNWHEIAEHILEEFPVEEEQEA